MLTRRVIPCLDCRDGRVVKGVRFSDLRVVGSPVECAAIYESQGADELVLLDISATPEGRDHNIATVRAVREVLSIPLTVGGGVGDVNDAGALLETGADKIAINTAAVADPSLMDELARRFGCQCIVLAVDAARTKDDHWEVVVRSGRVHTGLDVVAWCREGVRRGAGEILLTSWDRDGTRDDYDLELVACVSSEVTAPVVASGGAASPRHLLTALHAGADAVLAASIFHDGEYNVQDAKQFLADNGVRVRL